MNGRKSRNKGAVGERELSAALRAHGIDANRNARNGLPTEDIAHCIPGVWLEVKRCEKLCLPQWIRQAEADAPPDAVPVVAFRQNHQSWRVAITLDHYLSLLKPQPQECNDASSPQTPAR